MAVYRITPPQNPLARALAAVVALALFAGAFMLGLVALAVVAGLAVLLGAFAWLNAWRLRRKLRRSGGPQAAAQGQTIEAEYTVVSRRRDPP